MAESFPIKVGKKGYLLNLVLSICCEYTDGLTAHAIINFHRNRFSRLC